MSLKLLKQILDAEGNEHLIKGSIVVDPASGKTFEQHVADTTIHLTNDDVTAITTPISTEIAAVKKMVTDFLEGEADEGDIDRLVELVTAIQNNKTTIDSLLKDKLSADDILDVLTSEATDKALSAKQGKVLKDLIDGLQTALDELGESNHGHTNKETLDAISKDAAGDLTFNGKTLDGKTSVAFVANSTAEPVFDGKLVMVVEAYNPAGEEPVA